MCTALNFSKTNSYFGRNLDLDYSYQEQVCVMPRHFPLNLRKLKAMNNHYALIGMATIMDGYPLFYDAANEHGLCMAGLNFPDNAHFYPLKSEKDNICQFELIPYILGRCKNLAEAKALIENINLVDITFSENVPTAHLHWIVSYKDEAIVIEPMEDGMHIYDNPLGVLTNNPPFDYQLFSLNNYRHLSNKNGDNRFGSSLSFDDYCQGLGGLGMPGDVSSMSRFIRTVFYKENSVCNNDEMSCVSQFFHILGSVEMCRGGCKVPSGGYDITLYSSCINADKGLYYYATYGNRRISCVDMHRADLDGKTLSIYPLLLSQSIEYQN